MIIDTNFNGGRGGDNYMTVQTKGKKTNKVKLNFEKSLCVNQI